MTGNHTSSKHPRPICGVLSLALPLAVAALAFIAIVSAPQGDSGSLGTAVFGICATIAFMVVGIVLAIIALFRREKWRLLPWLAIALNAAAVVPLVRMVFF